MRTFITTVGAITTLALMPLTFGADAPAKKPAAAATTESQMVGKWAPDPGAMLAQFKKEIGDDAQSASMLPLIQAMLQNMAVEVTKGKVIIHAMGQSQTATYKVTKADETAKKVTMTVTDEDGESGGTATIKDGGKKLILSKDGEDIVLNKITDKDFEKRKVAAQQPPAIPGLE
jgi:hypothetical protein